MRRVEDATKSFTDGVWRLANVAAIAGRLRELALRAPARFLLDAAGARLSTPPRVHHAEAPAGIGVHAGQVSGRAFDPRYERLLLLVYERMATPPSAGHTVHMGLVQRVGAAVLRMVHLLKTHVDFVGVVMLELLSLVRRPGRFRIKETVSQFGPSSSTRCRSWRWSTSSSAW